MNVLLRMHVENPNQPAKLPKENAAAARVVAQMLGGQLVGGQLMQESQVTASIGLQREEYEGHDTIEQPEILQFTIHNKNTDTMPAEVKAAALKVLAALPVLKDTVVFEKAEDHVIRLKEQLKAFKAQGADIADALLDWRGFNPDKAGTWNQAPDHALQINQNEFGYSVHIDVEHNVKKVVERMRARLPEIKKTLAERIIKYKGAADEAAKACIRQKVEQMQVELTFHESQDAERYSSPGSITLNFSSPEQALAKKNQNVPGAIPPDQLALTNTNVLTGLTTEQTGKAFGRAVLFSGSSAMEDFPLIAGREDMRRVIGKALTKFKAEHPDQAEAVDKFLKEDDFKARHDWNKPASQQEEKRKFPLVNKDPSKPGEMTITLTLPKGKAWEAIQQIAAMDTVDPTRNFAQVDNMELVGVVGPQGKLSQDTFNTAQALIATIKESQEAMRLVMNQIAGRAEAAQAVSSAEQKANEILYKFSGPQTVEKSIEPLAREVVLRTEEAFSAIEKSPNVSAEIAMPVAAAHNAIQRALQKAGGAWDERAKASRSDGASLGVR